MSTGQRRSQRWNSWVALHSANLKTIRPMLRVAALLAVTALLAAVTAAPARYGSFIPNGMAPAGALVAESATASDSDSSDVATTQLKLRTILTCAALDPQPQLHTDLPRVPEPGTELRSKLEADLADSLFEVMDEQTFTSRAFHGVTQIDIVSMENGQMDAYTSTPVSYAFVEVDLKAEFEIDSSCVRAHELRGSDACAQSADAIADVLDGASAALHTSLHESDLELKFSDSGDDGFSHADPRADDFELLAEGGTPMSSAQLRIRAK